VKVQPTELVQHSAYRGSSRRRKGSTSHIINMVWTYRSPLPVGRKGVFYENYLPSHSLEEGKGNSILWWECVTFVGKG
jgi:hypothetical protein